MTMDSFVYRKVDSKYFDYPAHILGLDHYDEDSAGEHDFSRKQVWFYVYGDDDIEQEFVENLSKLFESAFNGNNDYWDYMTLMPSHEKAGYNKNMNELLEKLSTKTGVENRKILHRNHTIRDNHELDSFKEKVVNSESSIDLQEDVEGKNILLVDNISVTGCSLLHATELLKRNGANNVACVVLGLGINGDDDILFDEDSGSKISDKIGVESEVK